MDKTNTSIVEDKDLVRELLLNAEGAVGWSKDEMLEVCLDFICYRHHIASMFEKYLLKRIGETCIDHTEKQRARELCV